jgi:protein SCO1/2
MRRLRYACAFLVLLLPLAGPAHEPAESTQFSPERALAVSQAAIGRTLADVQLLDTAGNPVSLSSYRGRPLVISLIYTSCYHTCPALTRSLAQVTRVAREALGEDSFSVITVGFDTPVDTPARMTAYAAEQGIALPHWDFLAADAAQMRQLTENLGFIYFPSPKGFDHLAQLTLVDADGVIHRQIYGDTFQPPQLVEPLKALIYGGGDRFPVNVSEWINNLKLFCTVYDPRSGRYMFDYSILVSVLAGVLSLGVAAAFIIHLWRRGHSGPPTGVAG